MPVEQGKPGPFRRLGHGIMCVIDWPGTVAEALFKGAWSTRERSPKWIMIPISILLFAASVGLLAWAGWWFLSDGGTATH